MVSLDNHNICISSRFQNDMNGFDNSFCTLYENWDEKYEFEKMDLYNV